MNLKIGKICCFYEDSIDRTLINYWTFNTNGNKIVKEDPT